MENLSPEESEDKQPTKYPEEFAGEPWDEFEFWLSHMKDMIIGMCGGRHGWVNDPAVKAFLLGNKDTYPDEWVDDHWVETTRARLVKLNNRRDKDVELLWQETRLAWELLGTPQNRLRTLQLLYDAAKEFADQIYHGPQFMQATKTERKAQQRALQRARTKAVKTINTAGQAVVDYLKAAIAVESFSDRPALVDADAADFLPAPSFEASKELYECLKELQNFAAHFSRIPVPTLLAKEPGQRGRRKKSVLNTALLTLVEIFQSLPAQLSRNKALEYTHCLLYLSGVWPDDDPHGLAAKLAQLRKSHRQRPS